MIYSSFIQISSLGCSISQLHPPDLLASLSHPLIGGWPQGQAGCSRSGAQAEERRRWQADPGKNICSILNALPEISLLNVDIFSLTEYLCWYLAGSCGYIYPGFEISVWDFCSDPNTVKVRWHFACGAQRNEKWHLKNSAAACPSRHNVPVTVDNPQMDFWCWV